MSLVSSSSASDLAMSGEVMSEELKDIRALWETNGWPSQIIDVDPRSAKILHDNDIFNLIKFFRHDWKWDPEDGLVVLQKKSVKAQPAFAKWEDILASAKVKTSARGEFLFTNVFYGADGFEFEQEFHYSPADFKGALKEWIERGWPVQLLLRDHYGAKVLYDNQVFPLLEFYGHEYKWDDAQGLSLLFKPTPTSPAEWTPWTEIAEIVPVQITPQGWLLFDGWNYKEDGLVPEHLWEWQKLTTSYEFPSSHRPDYCYLDIVTFCWEHNGMPGFGVGSPHGHTSIEFGDDEGSFYSVGQYMHPRSKINSKTAPAAMLKACLMSPDPYMPSKGEKTIHRYNLGTGVEGRNNLALLKKHVEDLQGWRRNPTTGVVTVCPSMRYNMFKSNCGNFVVDIETYAKAQLGARLHRFTDDEVFPPYRDRVTSRSSGVINFFQYYYNRCLLWFVDMLIFIATSVPAVADKLGRGRSDDFEDTADAVAPSESAPAAPAVPATVGQMSRSPLAFMLFSLRNIGSVLRSLRPRRRHKTLFPRRLKTDQLYSPRLKNYTVKLQSPIQEMATLSTAATRGRKQTRRSKNK
eukprot:TRINITY_DN6369_c0_g1_i3.p1 TRINITY_DN6369_c0_g1~~TRINITY_DN6369_c0_g1_i3.p1  ORF type:complete len:603 (+),score=140.14 TRINITY_DN6369_c0_g1_i3:80-1810(+)